MAEMYIPISLFEQTKNSENRIFEAISLEDMRNLMHQSFADETLIDTFSLFCSFTKNERESAMSEAIAGNRPRIKAEILFTKMAINLSPNKVNDVASFIEYSQNIKILEDLQPYRPLRRPITKNILNESEKHRKKRKLIVRDWFFYVVWSIRLKKLIKSAPKIKEEHDKKLEEYKKLYEKMEKNRGDSRIKDLDEYMKRMKQKIELEIAKKEQEKEKSEKNITGIKLTLRCQEISIKCFSNNSDRISLGGVKQPIMELQIIVFFDRKI